MTTEKIKIVARIENGYKIIEHYGLRITFNKVNCFNNSFYLIWDDGENENVQATFDIDKCELVFE